MEPTALQRAIEAAGGTKALSRKIGISSQAISQWQECPPLRVLGVEEASGISRHELRPDLYPIASDTAPAPLAASAA
ncbi:transcriptional regulator [Methylobacterium pseudosasicola]|uniref:transcriptional regulator n=1 Tax=Methylobacterium pseudosasicola TaxID=582667 RepID=UPI000B895C03|nr:YdaS family helix-turn-helix protein [Methylobacterium pseudosasicola]